MTLAEQLTAVAARWAHGHDELINDCSLCQGEWTEVRTLLANQPCTGQEER